MGRKRKLTKAQRAFKQAAAKWKRLPKSKKAKYEGGFRDFVKVELERKLKAKKRKR